MHIHHLTLSRLAAELNSRFKGAMWMECFSQDKDELLIGIASENRQLYLRVVCGMPLPCIWPVHEFSRAKKNVAELFPEAKGRSILGFSVIPFDRVLVMALEGGYQLYIRMHGAKSNVMLDGGGQRMLFRNRVAADRDWQPVPGFFREDAVPDTGNLPASLRAISPVLDAHFAARTAIHIASGATAPGALQQSWKEANEGEFYCSMQPRGPEFLLFPLKESDLPLGKDVVSALDRFLRAKFRYDQYAAIWASVKAEMDSKLASTEKASESYKENLVALRQAREPEETGNLILSSLHTLLPGADFVETEDFYRGGSIRIPLKPDISPQENAAVWFRKQKQRKAQLARLEQLVQDAELERENIRRIIPEWEGIPAPADALQWDKGYPHIPAFSSLQQLRARLGLEAKEQKAGSSNERFHTFEFRGYEIFAGRNARNNDQLSFHFARKNDIWLHAKDVAGSHVVVRNPTGKELPRPVLEFAAKLAARNSKRRNESLVPVAWTWKKYVRKPKGLPPGQVIADRESVILVSPEAESL